MDAHSLVVFSFVEAHHMRLPWDIQDLHGRFEGRICCWRVIMRLSEKKS
jgi:hypothetical protein